MRAEGTEFRCGVEAGTDVFAETLRASYDAIVLAGGARWPGTCRCPGVSWPESTRPWKYLPLANRVVAGNPAAPADPDISARGSARGHHRRRRHRRGLPGHRATVSARRRFYPARDPARPPRAGPAISPGRPTHDLPGLHAHEKAAIARTRSPTLEFLAMSRGGSGAATGRRGQVRPVPGTERNCPPT